MSTDRRELEQLQVQVRRIGGGDFACRFVIGTDGWIESVFYKDHEWPPLAFAEQAREDIANAMKQGS